MTIPISVELDIPHFKESQLLSLSFAMNNREIHKASKIHGNHIIKIDDVALLPNSRNTFTMKVSDFQNDYYQDPFHKVYCRIKNIEFDEIPLNSLIGSHGRFRPENSADTITLPDQTINDNGCWILEFNNPLYHWMFEQT